jgi:hypothetical protein
VFIHAVDRAPVWPLFNCPFDSSPQILALIPSTSPDSDTNVLSLIDAIGLDVSPAHTSTEYAPGASVAVCLSSIVVSLALCVVAFITAQSTIDGRISLVNESEIYPEKQD